MYVFIDESSGSKRDHAVQERGPADCNIVSTGQQLKPQLIVKQQLYRGRRRARYPTSAVMLRVSARLPPRPRPPPRPRREPRPARRHHASTFLGSLSRSRRAPLLVSILTVDGASAPLD
ncbi:hypothetical protein J6590_016563 [Homalodisca vitripennis]|nr:hypothetical protein J6590_016563 [Homalodisca vitripennis]